jgi:hypothetical protein
VKKLLFLVVLCFAVSGCVCKAEKRGIEQVEKTLEVEDSEYLRYVQHDPLLTAEQKDDKRKLIESRKRLLEAVKKSME